MPNTNVDIGQLPKQFCENIVVGSNDQMFMLITLVGVNAVAYAITPEHAKNLVKALSEQVERFEKNVRPIADLSKGLASPIQMSELGGNSKGNSSK
jgi:hypothetical protein